MNIKNTLALILFCFLGSFASAQSILSLEQALEIAEEKSPDLLRTKLNVERTSESLKAKRASLKTQFSFRLNPVNYNRRRTYDQFNSSWYTSENFSTSGKFTFSQPVIWTDGTISFNNDFGWQNNYTENKSGEFRNKTFYNDLYLSLKQPLFTYNKTKLELAELELDHENSMLDYAMQRLNMEKNVSQFFYDVYLAQMSLSISEDEYENTLKSHEIITNKVEAGLEAKEELYQSEVNLASAKSSMENKRVSLENAKDRFKQYIGMDIFEPLSVLADVQVTPVEVEQKTAINYGLNSRMEIRQREINVETSQFNMIRTKSENEFKGDLELSIGLLGEDEELNMLFDETEKTPRVNLSFNIPIWDWGERKAKIRAQEAGIKIQELSLENEKIQIVLDIRKVVRNLSNLENQIGIARQNEKNAQLTYDINLERYENGDLTGMNLNLYQTQLSEKKMAYAQSLINYKIELLNLKIQSLYDFEIKQPVVPEEFFREYQSKK